MKPSLRWAAVASAAAVALAACSAAPASPSTSSGAAGSPVASSAFPTEPVNLKMWWWGEAEAPGAQKWLDQAITAYQKLHPNVTITPTLQTTDGLIPAFDAAAAANQGPDIQYFWGGIYSQQPGWKNEIAPVSDYIPAAELSHYTNAKLEDSYQGKTWTAPWYVNPSFPVLANKALLAANGLGVPNTWDDLLKACDTLSAKGITTLAGGVKDGWFGGWLYSILGAQSIDSQKKVLDAVVGNASFTDPAMADWWTRLQETRQHKCWNDDINSLELDQAQQRFVEGKAAMTVTAGPDAPNFAAKAGGPAKIVVIPMPKWGSSPYAGQIASSSQTLGITKWSKYPQVAADFIMFTHTPAELQAWYSATGALPADDRFDLSQVTDPIKKQLFAFGGDGVPYIENFIPAQLDTDAVFKNVQLVLQGSETGTQAAADMQSTAERLRKTDRQLVDNFTNWAASS
jgi:raffinose/stachyose/melibiose transport system substrate-binding protein